MRLFKGKVGKSDFDEDNFKYKETAHTKQYIDVLSAFIGRARLRQQAFYDLTIKGRDWEVDFNNGVLSFGDSQHDIQFIGTESYVTNTWLWGVDNVNNFKEEIVKDAYLFFSSSMMGNLEELKSNELVLDEYINGHNLASIISAAHYEKVCYFKCPMPSSETSAFVLVRMVPDEVFAPAGSGSVSKLIVELLSQLPLNHKILVKNILIDNCSRVEGNSTSLTGYFRDNTALTTIFDYRGHLESMELSFTAAAQ
ncbi:MAG: hypothetical protein FWG10_00160 [Eubacteriaceae bacterium]|nr:hypothetical protein [Eubacteriaceae bacterium]